MPPSVGRTLFVSWLAQQQADRQANSQALADRGVADERAQTMALARRDADRKDYEAKAREVGEQQEVLGEPQPEITDMGGQIAQELGAGEARAKSRLEQLANSRLMAKEEDRRAREEFLARLRGGQKIDELGLKGEQNLEAIEARGAIDLEGRAIPGDQRRSLEEEVLEPGRTLRAREGNATRVTVAGMRPDPTTKALRPAASTTGRLQKTIDDADRAIMGLENIVAGLPKTRDGKPDFSEPHTYQGRSKLWVLQEIDKIPGMREQITPEQRTWLADQSGYRSVLDKNRAAEIRALLGAAQTSIEMKNIMNAVLSGHMGPTQALAAYEAAMSVAKRERDHAYKRLQQGYGAPVSLSVPGAPAGRVRIQLPDGRTPTLPAEQVEAFLASPQGQGAKVIQ